MCNGEKFQLIICSQDRQGNNITVEPTAANNPANSSFFVNWSSVLPEKYKRFNVRWSFVSGNANSADNGDRFKALGLVYINFYEGVEQFDTHTKSKNGLKYVGFIERVNNTNYISKLSENAEFSINRPKNNRIDVRIYSTQTIFDNTLVVEVPSIDTPVLLTNNGNVYLQDWILTLEFSPVE
jgi:hypothetical protein